LNLQIDLSQPVLFALGAVRDKPNHSTATRPNHSTGSIDWSDSGRASDYTQSGCLCFK